MEKTEKLRLNLALSKDVKDNMDSLKVKTGADSYSEVIRRSLALYDFLVSAQKRGEKIYLTGQSDQQEPVMLQFF